MTTLCYECIGADGKQFSTKSYVEAQEFKERNGGTIKTIEDSKPSSCEAFCKSRYRKPSSRT